MAGIGVRSLGGNWCGKDEEKQWWWTMWSGRESQRRAGQCWSESSWGGWREGQTLHSLTACLPVPGWGFHIKLPSSLHTWEKPSISPTKETHSPRSMVIHIKDDNLHLLSITSLAWISWKLFLHPSGIQPGLSSMTDTTWWESFFLFQFCSLSAYCSKKYFPQIPLFLLHIS